MSDQPQSSEEKDAEFFRKANRFYSNLDSEQPQEWTYEHVKKLLLPNFGVDKIRAVMEAHNAAVANERRAHNATLTAIRHEKEVLARLKEQYQQQLAAEREKVKHCDEMLKRWEDRYDSLLVKLWNTEEMLADALAKVKQ